MESVQETPAKRRKTGDGYKTVGQAYDSQDDSGDNLFDDYETVATVPLPQQAGPPQQGVLETCSTPAYLTQPTQIIHPASGEKSSVIQVAASSPFRLSSPSSPAPTKIKRPGGILASAMAPAGTAFRPPIGIKKSTTVELSDDEGPTYRGGSSDDETQRRNRVDIKPSTFIQSAPRIAGVNAPGDKVADSSGVARFKEITSSSFYKPMESYKPRGSALSGSIYDSRNRDENHTTSRFAASKRSGHVMANVYRGSTRPVNQAHQTAPAKAQQAQDLSIDDIEDYQLRNKVLRMQEVLPRHSILSLKNALTAKRANFDDAIDFLMSQEEQPQEIDLTLSDHELDPLAAELQRPKKAPAKQQIKAPVQKIHERWTATQAILKNNQPTTSPETVASKPRRRLVQGRKLASPSLEALPKPLFVPARKSTPLSDDSDSAIGHESEADVEIEGKVLNFLNTCSVPDLVDIAAISDETANLLLSQKPFRSLEEARQITSNSAGPKKKAIKKPIGDKIVDKCIDMWAGYEAVDSLVRQCEALGKPVADEMKKWGVDVFGESKDGELDLVSFNDVGGEKKSHRSTRDSGIGTPTSTSLSADENSDVDLKKSPKQSKESFYHQPKIMGDGITLKDYQVVGINWLSLLFEKQLSCILADDMGLGKTCQVIAFLALLSERGIKGPHLIVVPGSTLENWLREFSIFCPSLVVMPYYGTFSRSIL
jgi:SWI/SNF-related matrix-associated actin-dependent regulator of chromatin subfamily A containing DEAD/H box 1